MTTPEKYIDEHGGDSRPSAYWEFMGEIVPGPEVHGADDSDHDATLVVRCHALGKCAWELAAMLQGHTPEDYPDAIKAAFAAGHEYEPKVLERLEKELGFTFVPGAAQAQGELAVGARRVVRFHPDEVAIPPVAAKRGDAPHVVEVKALSGANFDKACKEGVAALGYGYDWQLSTMMLAYKMPGAWALLDKESGNIALRYIDEPPRSRAEIVRRVKEIHDVAMGEDLAVSGRPCDQPDQWPCLFRHLRPEPEGDIVPELPKSHVTEFVKVTGRYLKAKAAVEAATADRDGYRDQLRYLSDDLGMDKMVGPNGVAVTISRSTPVLVDRKKLAADDLLAQYSVLGAERVTVKVTEPKR